MTIRVSECRSCGAQFRWVTTPKGKKMPLDLDPVPKGPWIIDGDPEEHDPKVVYIGERDPYTGLRYESHFATCPNAEEHSKGRRK